MTRHTKKFLEQNSLAILRPEIAQDWDHILNDKGPENYSVGSNYNAFWKCKKLHSWRQKICHRTRKNGIGCPTCAGRIQTPLKTEIPEIYRYLHPEKNMHIDLDKITSGSQKEAWFQCDNGHEFNMRIGAVRRNFLNGVILCPFCGKRKPSKDYNLARLFPDLASEWDVVRNQCSPELVLPSSNKPKYWWICSRGHSYDMSINARTNKTRRQGCPYCAGQRTDPKTSLEAQYPELCVEWDYEKNSKHPREFTPGSNKRVWWKCKFGHEWQAAIHSRSNGKGCPRCSNQTSKVELRLISELECVFSLVVHREKIHGEEVDIFIPEIRVGIEYDGYWFHKNKKSKDCNKLKALTQNGIKLIRIREAGLPKVQGSVISLKKSEQLSKTTVNRLLKMIATPEVRHKVTKYLASSSFINERRFQELCSFLPGPLPGNSLAVKFPEIASEWDYNKNAPLKPTDVSFGSNFFAYWKCSNQTTHSYRMAVKSRTDRLKGQNCPYCSGRRVAPERSLQHLFPEIANQWDYSKNLKGPSDYTYASQKKVWWKCPVGHNYEARISSRTRKSGGTGCKKCHMIKVKCRSKGNV